MAFGVMLRLGVYCGVELNIPVELEIAVMEGV
jgi:hypothetical protein